VRYLAYPENPVSSDALDIAATGLRTLARNLSGDQAFAESDRAFSMLSMSPESGDRFRDKDVRQIKNLKRMERI